MFFLAPISAYIITDKYMTIEDVSFPSRPN